MVLGVGGLCRLMVFVPAFLQAEGLFGESAGLFLGYKSVV
ncbi:hypothetical protein GGR09_000653 [Bartonella heixiaziensis]